MKVNGRKCRQETELIFYGMNVCDRCWTRHCEGNIDLKAQVKGDSDAQV